MAKCPTPSLNDVLQAALSPFGISPRHGGAGKLRIPAIWRGSTDFNVVVYADGGWFDFAHSETGNLRELLERINPDHALDLKQLHFKQASAAEQQKQRDTRIRDAQRLWRQGAPLLASPQGQVVRAYLNHRGLPETLLPMMAQHCRVAAGREGGAILMLPIYRPAAPYPLTGLQRIYLTAEGHKDDGNGDPKKMFGPHMSKEGAGGVLLPADRSRVTAGRVPLCLCEGYETGLAIHAASGYPVYVLYDKEGLKKASIAYLRTLQAHRIIICADNDKADHRGTPAGLDAAMRLSRRLRLAGLRHQVAIPPLEYGGRKGADWLDVWGKAPDKANRLLHASTSWRPLFYSSLKENEL